MGVESNVSAQFICWLIKNQITLEMLYVTSLFFFVLTKTEKTTIICSFSAFYLPSLLSPSHQTGAVAFSLFQKT